MGIENFIGIRCTQTAVYWGNPTEDGRGGRTFDSPVELSVRWEKLIQKVNTNDPVEEIISDAQVTVLQDVDERGYLYLGELTDFDSTVDTSDPVTIEGAYEIKKFEKLPSIRGGDYNRKAYL